MKQIDETPAVNRQPRPEMLLGMSLPALVELCGIPAKFFSVAGFEMVLFECGGQYLVCTCSQQTCVQARYSDTRGAQYGQGVPA